MTKKFLFLVAILFATVANVCANNTCSDSTATINDSIASEQNVEQDEHQYIDLGLSSGVKWATCNLGATKPEEYGWYFMWGNTENCTNAVCSKVTSKTYGMEIDDISHNPAFDAATVNWGKNWRMPTKREFSELRSECFWLWTTIDGINGYLVRSKKNGNSIFLPAAGYKNGTSFFYKTQMGYYWTSTPETNSDRLSDLIYISVGTSNGIGWYGRYYAMSIRPVSK